jgi:hypothetical protein
MRKRYLENGTVLNLGPIVPWEKSDPDYAHLHGQLSEDAIRQILKSEASEKYRIRASFVLRSPSRTAMPEA